MRTPAIHQPKAVFANGDGRQRRPELAKRPQTSLAPLLGASYQRELRRGLRILAIAACLIVPIAAFVPLTGAVVSSGRLIAASNVKKVQHPVGGVISEILVEDGAQIARGDVLARLDPKQAESELAMLAAELVEVRMREARLLAERDRLSEPDWPLLQVAGASPGAIAAAEATQGALFLAHGQGRQSDQALLGKELEEQGNELNALRADMASKSEQAKIVAEELAGLEGLYAQRLVAANRVMAQRREATSLKGETERLKAQIAETDVKISSTRLQMTRAGQVSAGDVLKEFAEVQEKQLVLTQQHTAALDKLKHLEIRAPQSGTVHELMIHTVGGVIGPGEVLMLIAPSKDGLLIETRLQIRDIDQVFVGQAAELVMPALDRATTPRLSGAVSYVSPDATRDSQTNSAYYTVRVTLKEPAPGSQSFRLIAGMPVEIFLETESRSVASYLFKPLTDQLLRMFKDR